MLPLSSRVLRAGILAALLGASPSATAQPFSSPYLADPDLAIGYVDSCARFWLSAHDAVLGGFYMNIDRAGFLISGWGTGKNTLNQSRDAYGLIRAYQLTGNGEFLTYARRALEFQYAHGWDSLAGGWFNAIDRFGAPTQPSAAKTAYHQHYAILGPTAAWESTDDSLDRAVVERSLAHMEAKFWDDRPGTFGYYDRTLADGSSPSGKSFNATVDAVTTHLLQLVLMTGDTAYATRLLRLADNMVNRLEASAAAQAIGFVEGYDADWNPDPSNTMTIMGHVLKTAWCLTRMHALVPDTAYAGAAKRLVASVLAQGYDHELGGPYKDYNRLTGEMLMWGQQDTAKAWWQMEQAVTAGLLMHAVFGDPEYLAMADGSLDFFMRHFVDPYYGEVFADRTRYGGPLWGTAKGNDGKAAYHSIELGYYVYLYGNLLLHGRPATLRYAFSPVARARSIRLQPICVPVRIAAVTLDGAPYAGGDWERGMLDLPPMRGGEFAVTFAPLVTAVAEAATDRLPAALALAQNYPNPFNPATTIEFELGRPDRVRLRVFDVLGREIATLAEGPMEAGRHRVRFDASGLPSGVYLYRLETPGATATGSMVLAR